MCLQIFKNGNRAKPVEYDGPREADGIVSKLLCTLDALLLAYLLRQQAHNGVGSKVCTFSG